jgi:hypothetical protein
MPMAITRKEDGQGDIATEGNRSSFELNTHVRMSVRLKRMI